MPLVTQAAYAASHGVSRKTATKWKQAGHLVLAGDRVDADASDDRLRGAALGRFKGVTQDVKGKRNGKAEGNAASGVVLLPADTADPIEDLSEFVASVLRGEFATQHEAERVKENALALKHVLDAQQKAGALVDIEVAEAVLFDANRAQRDAWLNWPSRIGPLLAADLGVDAGKVTEALTAYVHQQVTELGEPEADFIGHEG